jgi:RND family efflux transporter MFP subunit
VPVSELDVTGLREGDAVDVTMDALPGRPVSGRIRRIFPAADTLTRLVPVEVALTGASAGLARPGFLARVTFHYAPRTGVLMVPAAAVVDDASGASVWTVRGGRASRVTVRRGGTFEGRVEIAEGLAPGDTVVVAGNVGLRDGAEVRVVQPPSLDVPADAPLGGDTAAARRRLP